MGKEKIGLTDGDEAEVKREVDALRGRTEAIVAEIERRVRSRVNQAEHALEIARRAIDVPAQLRSHPRVAAGLGAGALIALGFGVYLGLSGRARARRPIERLRRRFRSYGAILAHPENVTTAPRPSSGRRVLGALVVALVTTVVTTSVARGLPRLSRTAS